MFSTHHLHIHNCFSCSAFQILCLRFEHRHLFALVFNIQALSLIIQPFTFERSASLWYNCISLWAHKNCFHLDSLPLFDIPSPAFQVAVIYGFLFLDPTVPPLAINVSMRYPYYLNEFLQIVHYLHSPWNCFWLVFNPNLCKD